METSDKNLFKHKLDYLKLTLKISKMRYHGEKPSSELLSKAQYLGGLAKISDDELNTLLWPLDPDGRFN